MERRLFTFIVASTAFFFFYFSLRVMFAPQGARPGGNQAELNQPADEPANDDLVDQADVDEPSAQDAEPEDTRPDQPAPERPDRPVWVTLGSMRPATNYYMLVTLNSRGGGIERLELTERDSDGGLKYRRVDVRHGYFGYLAAETSANSNGVLVNVVGPGTPADLAGVKVGDVIVALAGQAIGGRADMEEALLKTKPDDAISVEVMRSGKVVNLNATLTQHPLDLIRLARDGGADQIQGNLSELSCLLSLSHINRKSIRPNERSISGMLNPAELVWNEETNREAQSESVEFELELAAADVKPVGGQPIRMQRSYSLTPQSYAIDMSVQIDNLDDQQQDLAYRLEGPNGITLEGWWYSTKISPNFSGAAARDIVFKTVAEGHELVSGYELLKHAKKDTTDSRQALFAPDESDESRTLKYIGVDAQYFTVAYIPPEGQESFRPVDFRRASAGVAADPKLVARHKERAVNATFFLDSGVATVPAKGYVRQDLRLFAGPKKPELLAQHRLSDCIYYGWFSWFAIPLASLLHVLAGIGNYALAIILLTVIVRGGMFPLSRKAAINAQKMQELAPELKKINDKYKDDMEGKMKAQRELQQRVGFNPLAGCLPMFLQLPIFIGLYRALSVDIELRQQAFSSATDWASNLAGPDMFWYWGDWLWDYLSGRGTGWLGPYFNVLPVLVVVLFLLQQKMFMPPATDEQTAMTQKMMNIMTLMMGLFFFRVPAGLCIYFITSSLWGIAERVLVKKTLPTGKHFDEAVLEGTATPKSKDSASIAERLKEKVAKPETPIERPNKRKRPKKKR